MSSSRTDPLETLAIRLAEDGPHKTYPANRQLQLLFQGVYIVRTTEAQFVWEVPYYPQLYFPVSALTSPASDKLHADQDDPILDAAGKVIAHKWILTVGNTITDRVVVFSDTLTGPAKCLRGLVKVEFAAMDQWFEESTPIYVHPKDPFKRVDVVQSTRPLKISIRGVIVAETTTSMHLYETGLQTRYYFPLTDVKQGVLRPSKTRTQCPYKGEAEYYSVDVGDGEGLLEDVVWYYTRPTLECAKIEGLVCFYNEKVDIELDGKMLEKK